MLLGPLAADRSAKRGHPIQLNSFHDAWNSVKFYSQETKLAKEFETFKKAGEAESELWRYWNICLDILMPVVINSSNGSSLIFKQELVLVGLFEIN